MIVIMTASTAKPQQDLSPSQLKSLSADIKRWAKELGFDGAGITDTNLQEHELRLNNWISKGMHGEMSYMHKHGTKRTRPEELIEGTKSVISVRMDYAPEDIRQAESMLSISDTAYISRYALGRDYHKVLRSRLKKLAQKLSDRIGEFGYRVFTDSAPVMEKALAEKAGLGWIGKHSNLLHSKAGSWFFLGELYVDLELPTDTPATNHCGSCTSCISFCPTNAIIGPYQVDARRCISYLTIELKGSIPEEFRPMIGNRVYGCDDCQIVCPWNKFAQTTKEKDFTPRAHITDQKLVDLFRWTEEEFLKNTEGSAIRRIGYQAWVRNIAVGLGNMRPSSTVATILKGRQSDPNIGDMAREHITWALERHTHAAELTNQALPLT